MLSSQFNTYSEYKRLSPTRLSVSTCLVWTAFLVVTGCVEESRYQAVTAEVEQVKADVERMQAEAKAFERQMASLRALNDQEERTLTELQTELQKENDAATRMQQYEDRIATLQTRANTLLSQNRTLLREIREAKKQETSLQALVTRYEEELNPPQPGLENVTAPPVPKPDLSTSPGAAPQSSAATAPPETLASAPAPQPQAPPQTQTPAPAQTAPPPPPQQQPATGESDESWWSTIIDWLSTAWNWIFS